MAATAIANTYPTTEKIGFLTRALATIIDFVLLAIVGSILTGILRMDSTGGLSTLVGVAYYVDFWSSYGHGQTLGDRALKIRVVKTTGSELTLVDGLIRYVGLLISCIALFIGVIWVAFDANKQGWHDKIAGTYVIKA